MHPPDRKEHGVLVRTFDDVRAAGHEINVSHGAAVTRRLLTKRDGVGFSFGVATIRAGRATTLWYKHHWEANYILSGRGELEDLTTGRSWQLEAGFFYVVGPEDRHALRVTEDLEIISVFNPPLEGSETHDADGAYPPTGPIPPGPSA